MKVKNRNIHPTPSRVYSNSYTLSGIWNPKKHALLYQMLNKNGSSGDQKNAVELGDYGCICATHKSYGSSRMEGLGDYAIKNLEVHWIIIDIDKIPGSEKVTNRQYDRLVNKMICALDPRVKINRESNSDSLIYQVDQSTQRPLTPEEIHDYLDKLFGDGKKKTVFPPHTRQQEMIKERADFRVAHKDAKLILNYESAHPRFGKDKLNYCGLDPSTRIVVDCSGYFATWQIEEELNLDVDHWVSTRNKSYDDITKDIEYGLLKGKRIWIPLSTYNDDSSERLKILKLFKNTNLAIIADEPDYQQWRQIDFFKQVLEYVIN